MRIEYEKLREIERRMKEGGLPSYKAGSEQDWRVLHASASNVSASPRHAHVNTPIHLGESCERSDSGYGSRERRKNSTPEILHTRRMANVPSY